MKNISRFFQTLNIRWILAFLALVFLCFASFSLPLSFSTMRRIGSAETGPFDLPIFNSANNPGTTIGEDGQPIEGPPALSDAPALPPAEAWNGSDRVTMLIMGLDLRDWEGGGPSRSDTMILLTVDPLTKTGGILSVPRDLWAVIPGFSPGKINTAYYFGELYKVPGGGPALAMQTVEQTIGVPIDYYAVIDFAAFERFIDLLGGVKITVTEPIKVDPIGDRIPRTLQPGTQTMPGWLALAYARTRSAPGGDFTRAERQQQVVLAIRDRIVDFNMLPTFIANADEIYGELASGINTNLSLKDAIDLAGLAVQVPRESIQRGVIDQNYVTFGRSPDDLAILLPLPDKIRQLRDEIFTSSSAISPATPGDAQERMQLESAAVSVQNGVGGNVGETTAQYLESLGVNVVEVTGAETNYSQTTIIDYTGNPYVLDYLVDVMRIAPSRIQHDYNANSSVDVVIKIGSDWSPP
ncbi:MAG: LytR family transcriptional regulator [Chloroflexi bacterium]|nr:MAG: LytR family transcriptional regulator [Chloroflexota bacterium]MBL1197118.1 LytR family transcriptional regulator [Chloroflexota bacterium]NOH14413.1 LCP family protein [Chloroflexota bacterium]